jgi:hypothetical protein
MVFFMFSWFWWSAENGLHWVEYSLFEILTWPYFDINYLLHYLFEHQGYPFTTLSYWLLVTRPFMHTHAFSLTHTRRGTVAWSWPVSDCAKNPVRNLPLAYFVVHRRNFLFNFQAQRKLKCIFKRGSNYASHPPQYRSDSGNISYTLSRSWTITNEFVIVSF